MTSFTYIAIYGWIPLSIILFRKLNAKTASILVVFGGTMLLPLAGINIPGLPEFTKKTAISFGLLFGIKFSENKISSNKNDLFIISWCFLVPLLTTISNGQSLYGAISTVVGNILSWGVPYWAGRKLFYEKDSAVMLAKGVVIAGLVYCPLVIFEAFTGFFLHEAIYGWFQHSLEHHIRYGGFRPILFMKAGLMVSFWMSVTAVTTFWLWRAKIIKKIGPFPISFVFFLLSISTILCKSANGWLFLAVGIVGYTIYSITGKVAFLKLMLLLVPFYILFRFFQVIPVSKVSKIFSIIFDADRVNSLLFRLWQEDVFGAKAMQRPLFGWGGYRRGYPIDPYTGQELFRVIDSWWILALSTHGLFGVLSMFGTLGVGPWNILKTQTKKMMNQNSENYAIIISQIMLSIILIFIMIDSLVNAMNNAIYLFIAGALVSQAVSNQKEQQWNTHNLKI